MTVILIPFAGYAIQARVSAVIGSPSYCLHQFASLLRASICDHTSCIY